MTPLRPPIAGADKWVPVMERAYYRCECGAECGIRHKDGRCDQTDKLHDRLMAVSLSGDWAAPVAGLLAMCPKCWRKWLRRPQPQPAEPEGLF